MNLLFCSRRRETRSSDVNICGAVFTNLVPRGLSSLPPLEKRDSGNEVGFSLFKFSGMK